MFDCLIARVYPQAIVSGESDHQLVWVSDIVICASCNDI